MVAYTDKTYNSGTSCQVKPAEKRIDTKKSPELKVIQAIVFCNCPPAQPIRQARLLQILFSWKILNVPHPIIVNFNIHYDD